MRWRSVTSAGVSKLPRKAPDNVQEMRITFGNYERQFVTDIKTDIEKTVKYTAISTVAVPAAIAIGTVGGLGVLGYGIYRGLNSFGFGIFADMVEDAKAVGSVTWILLNKTLNPFYGTEEMLAAAAAAAAKAAKAVADQERETRQGNPTVDQGPF